MITETTRAEQGGAIRPLSRLEFPEATSTKTLTLKSKITARASVGLGRSLMKITFRNASEIRMGSPFRVADLEMEGDWKPHIPSSDYIDVVGWSADRMTAALARWEIGSENSPRFVPIIIEATHERISRMPPIDGACTEITFNERTIVYTVWNRGSTSDVPLPLPSHN